MNCMPAAVPPKSSTTAAITPVSAITTPTRSAPPSASTMATSMKVTASVRRPRQLRHASASRSKL